MKRARAKKYRIDFVCVHWYGGPDVDAFVNVLRKVHGMYRKPIWITEFAVGDWEAKNREQNRYPPEIVLSFMKKLLPKLDRLNFVERYAWFSAGEDSSALGTASPAKLRHVGVFELPIDQVPAGRGQVDNVHQELIRGA